MHRCSIIIGTEGDRFSTLFPEFIRRPPSNEVYVVIFSFLKANGVLTDALAAFKFSRDQPPFCSVKTSFGCSHDARFISQRVLPLRERAYSSLNRYKLGLLLSRVKEDCMVCQQAGRRVLYCGRCEIVCYCSRKCQKRDWKRHKELCDCMTKIA